MPWQRNPYARFLSSYPFLPVGQVTLCAIRVLLLWLVEIASRQELAATREAGRGRQAEALVTRLLTAICDATASLTDSLHISAKAPKLASLTLRRSDEGQNLEGALFLKLLAKEDRARFEEFLLQEEQRLQAGEPALMLQAYLVDLCSSIVPVRICVSMSLDDSCRRSYLVGIMSEETTEDSWNTPGTLSVQTGVEWPKHRGTQVAQTSKVLTLKFYSVSLKIITASAGVYSLFRSRRRHHEASLRDVLHDTAKFEEWIMSCLRYTQWIGEELEEESGPITLRVPVSSKRALNYQVVFKACFPPAAPDVDRTIVECGIDATILSCARCLDSDPSKGTPPASLRGSMHDLPRSSTQKADARIIGRTFASL